VRRRTIGVTKGGGLRIQLNDPKLVDDLIQFLARCDCGPREIGESAVVAVPRTGAGDPALSRVQLDGYLRVWSSMHPGVEARFD
jgi:hypothetical protein